MDQHHVVDYGSASEPASPMAQYMNNSVLSLVILGVLEFEVPLDDWQSHIWSLLEHVFLPLNSRFSSIMVMDESGVRKWKKVKVKLEDHVHVPEFPSSLLSENDDFLQGYLCRLALEPLQQSRPLWEVHMINYRTTEAAGTVVFKLHHSLGDGYSIMGALISCLSRADDPSLPLTFPTSKARPCSARGYAGKSKLKCLRRLPRVFASMFNTPWNFGWSLLKSTSLVDDQTPIWSGQDGIEFRPLTIAAVSFSLEEIKQVKSRLRVTVNDVICGVIFLGVRLYMRNESHGLAPDAKSTGLVLLNTRILREYKSVQEMTQPGSKSLWGNHFAFLHVAIPKLTESDVKNPAEFVHKAHKLIKMMRSSFAVHLTAQLLGMIKKFRGPETAAKYIHRTLKNSSLTITHVVGPYEKMALMRRPIKGLYYMVSGAPQSLSVCIISYAGKLRINVAAERGFIDSQKLASCINDAFHMIIQAAS